MIFRLKSNIVTFCSHNNTVKSINAVFTNFYFETLMLCCKHTHWNSSDSTKLTLQTKNIERGRASIHLQKVFTHCCWNTVNSMMKFLVECVQGCRSVMAVMRKHTSPHTASSSKTKTNIAYSSITSLGLAGTDRVSLLSLSSTYLFRTL